ncbi:MAG TPA: PQQ-dependent sugar dehydrogenase [Pyrinomonadaceae bacterium]|nr:PQQ-dependent sugar dehydrogenase [Pyrinomonadaceae bacterium]
MRIEAAKLRLIILPALLAACLGFFLSTNVTTRRVHAFSAGPPAGYTGAPGEEPEACAECHVPPDAGTGTISITAPQTYVPGQTYPITVTHSNPDPARQRWGFQLTVLDTSDEKAGELQSTNNLTQILNNQGPGSKRQYIEHTAAGTFAGQSNGASWTFNWTAPAEDIGPVTFYTAGNQANNDGNTSGDYVYRTFVASAPASTTPDFAINVSPSTRNVVAGTQAQYTVTITPLAGFTGAVNLGATPLPAGVTAAFNPATVTIADATSKTSALTLSTTSGTPIGNHPISVNAQSGSLTHSQSVALNVVSSTSADLNVTKTASPNPGQAGVNLVYRIVAANNGPAAATNVTVSDTLPAGLAFVSAATTQGACSGTTTVTCNLGSLANGAAAIVTITVTPSAQGQLANTATVAAAETDFDSSNNSSSITTFIQPAAATPSMLDANLTVSTVVSGLEQPVSLAFLAANDFLVLERATGRVRRVVNGVVSSTPLDLPVNNASERGLLGIALHPQFAVNRFVYLFWTESSTGVDTSNIDEITLLGNRVDRYVWNGSTLVFDRNLIRLRALQADVGQPARGNHNGGVIRFGPDGKLYIIFGDNGRRGFLQNITSGGPVPDDQFGGPEPDNAHLTGVILRLNDDGSTPVDNPFFNATTTLTGEAAANVKKVFAYGVRNSFGMAFDPVGGNLWTQENGDDAFDEINRVTPGFNGGWIQSMGPLSRIGEFKSIEQTYAAGNLQQLRWPPSNIAATPQEALARMFMLPGAQYLDPEFSWKYAVAPSPIGFIEGAGLGAQFEGDMLVGASRTTLLNGFLFRFKLTADRQHFVFNDQRLADRVADNVDKFDQTESESLVIGKDFGVTTDIVTGPNGNVFVVSLSNGSVYEIKAKPNPIDEASFFVRQHYLDFLNREPDAPGLAFWTGEITECSDPAKRHPGESLEACTERKRANTSAAFFLSPEFQNTGSFVLRVYWGTLGKLTSAQCPGVPQNLPGHCRPRFTDYLADMGQVVQGIVVNNKLDPAAINANKRAFVDQFVNRAEFRTAYPDAMSNQAFVDKLFFTTGITPTADERNALVNGLNGGTETRSTVVFKVVDGTNTIADGALVFQTSYGKAFYDQQFDDAFVFMQYICYLRRNPDQDGFNHWLAKLKQFGNWVDAQLVLAFIVSPEYRSRFVQ